LRRCLCSPSQTRLGRDRYGHRARGQFGRPRIIRIRVQAECAALSSHHTEWLPRNSPVTRQPAPSMRRADGGSASSMALCHRPRRCHDRALQMCGLLGQGAGRLLEVAPGCVNRAEYHGGVQHHRLLTAYVPTATVRLPDEIPLWPIMASDWTTSVSSTTSGPCPSVSSTTSGPCPVHSMTTSGGHVDVPGVTGVEGAAQVFDQLGLGRVSLRSRTCIFQATLHPQPRGDEPDRTGAGHQRHLGTPRRAGEDPFALFPRLGRRRRMPEQHLAVHEPGVKLDRALRFGLPPPRWSRPVQ
jgi:hypothetical protein